MALLRHVYRISPETGTRRPPSCCERAYRDGGKIKKRTTSPICPIGEPRSSKALRTLLKGGKLARLVRRPSWCAARCRTAMSRLVPGTLRDIALDRLLGAVLPVVATLAIAMIVARLIAPASKLVHRRHARSAHRRLPASAQVLGLGPVDDVEPMFAPDWLGVAPSRRSRRCSPASTCGTTCWCSTNASVALRGGAAANWRSAATTATARRASRRSSMSCSRRAGRLPGGDRGTRGSTPPIRETLAGQYRQGQEALRRLPGACGARRRPAATTPTQARIHAENRPGGARLGITALRAPAIRTARGCRSPGQCRCSTTATWSGGDHVARLSGRSRSLSAATPHLARERARKREDLLAATEKDLAAIAAAVRRARKPLRGEAAIALKVGAVVNRRYMGEYFDLVIGEAIFAASIARPRRSPPRRRWTESTSRAHQLAGTEKRSINAATVGACKVLPRSSARALPPP